MAGERILIVDDERFVGMALKRELGRLAYQVDSVLSGEEAVKLCRQKEYSVALIDKNMPGMNGVNTCRELKKFSQDLIVILITGENTVPEAELEAAGGMSYLFKPFLEGEVREAVKLALNEKARSLLPGQGTCTIESMDTLTQLVDRKAFLQKAGLQIKRAQRIGRTCAILFVDLDHFKPVNDTFGHCVGDALLKDAASRLAAGIRETDVMARFGGDEFIILLSDLEHGENAQYAARRILDKFNTVRTMAGHELLITVSIGIAVYPQDGDSLEQLLRHADTAMYAAKEAGRNRVKFYDPQMDARAIRKMQVEREIRGSLEKNGFALFYQPIVKVSDGMVWGFEALLRRLTPEGDPVLPETFLPVAEETGLIVPVGDWVVHEACRFNRKLLDAGYRDMVMSVNISAAQLRHKGFMDMLKSSLQQSGLPPEFLQIEVNEVVFAGAFDAAVEALQKLGAMGIKIALDRFGVGYSSLVYLQKIPGFNLKIDRNFINKIAMESDENAMIPAVVSLAHALKRRVVAVGVETREQLDKLSDNECDFYQGHWLSRPLPEEQVAAFLQGAGKKEK